MLDDRPPAGYILLVGVINLADPQYGEGFLALTSSLYPGLHFVHRWENLLSGAIYGFVDGAIGGWFFAWIYDHLVERITDAARRYPLLL